MTTRLLTVTGGLLFAVLGVLFLAEAHGAMTLDPAVLWPSLLIAWGVTLVGSAMPSGGRPDH